jgi:hypothetical protein
MIYGDLVDFLVLRILIANVLELNFFPNPLIASISQPCNH